MIGEQVGNFRIAALLGKGGMGEVYLAEHEVGTRVAIKLLLPHVSENETLVQRFFNEAIAVGQIQHAGIGKIFDSGTHAGRAYLVMELLPGETLAARIRRVGRLSLAETGELARQIAGVLEAVHNAGITHRDLKPDNIFIVPDDELGERIKIVDFGIAKLTGVGGGMTATTASALGTPAYMSPEQWKNAKHVDWRADAYSLGCVVFEMIAGRPPFIAETIGEACAKHLTEDAPRLASSVEVPAELDELVARLLEKSPERRPASLRDIATAFAAIAERAPTGLPARQARAPAALPLAGQGATEVSMILARPQQPSTLASARGPQAATRTRSATAWIAVGLGVSLAVAIAVLVVMMTRADDRGEPTALRAESLASTPVPPIALVEQPGPVAPVPKVEPPVEPPLQPPHTPKPRRLAQPPVMLRVDSEPPGAIIKLQELATKQISVLGPAPIQVSTIAPGKYRLLALLKGAFKDQSIELKPGEPFYKKFTFQSLLSTLPDTLDARVMQSVANQQVAEIRACSARPGGAFMSAIEVSVDPAGTVIRTRDGVPSTARSECLIQLLRRVKFPASQKGGVGKILFNRVLPTP